MSDTLYKIISSFENQKRQKHEVLFENIVRIFWIINFTCNACMLVHTSSAMSCPPYQLSDNQSMIPRTQISRTNFRYLHEFQIFRTTFRYPFLIYSSFLIRSGFSSEGDMELTFPAASRYGLISLCGHEENTDVLRIKQLYRYCLLLIWYIKLWCCTLIESIKCNLLLSC